MESVGGHNAPLGLHNPRKEWRVVTEGSARDRLTADGPINHGRVNGSARIRPLHSENSRNSQIFHSGASSGSSSDSDHHANDVKKLHLHEREEPTSNGHSTSASNGILLDLGVLHSSKHETLEHGLHGVIRQREHMQRVEADLRAQFIARSEILRVQSSFDEQAKQHASMVSSLQEQLQERDHRVHDLEQKLEERERQLHASQKEASEAVNQVWAKDGLLREQTSELASLRRERETLLADQKATVTQFESDGAHFLSRIQDLEDQLQEKDCQVQEMDDQNRTSQEALAYKDEQLREAQAWVQRAQELDAFYANSNNTLHAELRDRNEQLSQLWLGHQRQLAEVESYHSQTIQGLQTEVAEVREQNRVLKSGLAGNVDSKSEQSLHVSTAENANSTSTDSTLKLRKGAAPGSNQVECVGGLPLPASPVLGATASVLTGTPIPVLHKLAGQPEGVLPTIATAPTQITQSSFPNPVVIPSQHLPFLHRQAMHCKLVQQPQSSQRMTHPPPLPVYNHFSDTKSAISRGAHRQHQQIEQLSRDQIVIDRAGVTKAMDFPRMISTPVAQHSANMQLSVNAGPVTHQESSPCIEKQAMQEKHVNEGQTVDGLGINVALQDTKELPLQQKQQKNDHFFEDKDSVRDVDSVQFSHQLSHPIMHNVELQKNTIVTDDLEGHAIDSKIEDHQTRTSQGSAVNMFESQEAQINLGQSVQNDTNVPVPVVPQTSMAEGNSKSAIPALLDEKSLLACLVRTIPSEQSARIKISTTLPNRLGKMLAPLHWHDYKKQYGRLDDFISSHPNVFVTDEDFVHLKEGAHAIISATTAVAKVAAAAAAPTIGTNWPPTVAITPVAQSQIQRIRKTRAPVLLCAKEAAGRSGNQVKQDTLFSSVQINGNFVPHQGFASQDSLMEKQGHQHSQRNAPFNAVNSVNGSKLVSALRSRSDGTLSSSMNADCVEFSSASHGVSSATQESEMCCGGRKGARPNVVEAGLFVRKVASAPGK